MNYPSFEELRAEAREIIDYENNHNKKVPIPPMPAATINHDHDNGQRNLQRILEKTAQTALEAVNEKGYQKDVKRMAGFSKIGWLVGKNITDTQHPKGRVFFPLEQFHGLVLLPSGLLKDGRVTMIGNHGRRYTEKQVMDSELQKSLIPPRVLNEEDLEIRRLSLAYFVESGAAQNIPHLWVPDPKL